MGFILRLSMGLYKSFVGSSTMYVYMYVDLYVNIHTHTITCIYIYLHINTSVARALEGEYDFVLRFDMARYRVS